MSKKDSIQNEVKRLTEERNLYARLLEEANLQFEEKVKELSLLKRTGDIISDTFDIESFCRNLANIIIEETSAENCSLLLKDHHTERLILKVACGKREKKITFFEDLKKSNVIFSLGEGVAGKVALEGKAILIDDVNNDERFDHSRKNHVPIVSLLCCPLVLQEQVLGVINLSNSQPHAFSHNDMRAISIFSAFATSILSNARLYKETRDALEELKKTQSYLLQSEKMFAIGQLAAGVAHEINNPINGIINYAQLLIDQSDGQSEKAEIPNRIIKEGERVAGIVKNLLSFARKQEEEQESVLVHNIITDTLSLVKKQILKDGIKLTVDVPADLPKIKARSQQLQQVFMNIINNAQYALNQRFFGFHEDKLLKIRGEIIESESSNLVRTTFYDRGTGIPASIMNKIYNPFFSTKPRGEGTGLGLNISYGIIKDHGGKLWFDSVEGEYTKVIVDLPVDNGWSLERRIIPRKDAKRK